VRVIEVHLPEYSSEGELPLLTSEDARQRHSKLLVAMGERGLTHLVVYGDREHCANLSYLTGGYDSRFEESLLIVPKDDVPVLVVGNEGFGYSEISLIEHKKLLFQTFSLQGQTRSKKRFLSDLLSETGIDASSKIGIVGLKYYESGEVRDPIHTFDIPHYMVSEILELMPNGSVENATDIMTHPESGIRGTMSAKEIARTECMSNYLSSEMRRLIGSLRLGMSETDCISEFNYLGVPFSCHPVVNFGTERVLLGLSSPTPASKLERGETLSIAFGVEGANIARTGCAVESQAEFTGARKDILSNFYFPYFSALRSWYEGLGIGIRSQEIYREVMERIGNPRFGVVLNPGHQIHIEEWINSPFREDYDFGLRSGMAFQCDIIAFPGEPFVGVHVEDTVVIADQPLRHEIRRMYPDCWRRIEQRRDVMKNLLGIGIGDDILPMSNIQGMLHPFFLRPNFVITS
jgi:hypothetical protein